MLANTKLNPELKIFIKKTLQKFVTGKRDIEFLNHKGWWLNIDVSEKEENDVELVNQAVTVGEVVDVNETT